MWPCAHDVTDTTAHSPFSHESPVTLPCRTLGQLPWHGPGTGSRLRPLPVTCTEHDSETQRAAQGRTRPRLCGLGSEHEVLVTTLSHRSGQTLLPNTICRPHGLGTVPCERLRTGPGEQGAALERPKVAGQGRLGKLCSGLTLGLVGVKAAWDANTVRLRSCHPVTGQGSRGSRGT